MFKKKKTDEKTVSKSSAQSPEKKGKKKTDVTVAATPVKLSKEALAQKMESGHLRVIVAFEVLGKPKSFVEESLEKYMANLHKDSRIHVLSEETEPAEEQEEGLYSTFCEVEMLVENLQVLVWLAVNFTPASIEIIEPDQKVMAAADMTGWINDLLSKMHEVALAHRDMLQKNLKLNESLNALLKNSLLTALETKNLTKEELGKKCGVHPEQLIPFLDHLIEHKKIVKAADVYSIKKR